MPIRMMQRQLTVLISTLHANYLSTMEGWIGSTPEDIDRIEWVVDKAAIPVTRKLYVYKKIEGPANAATVRWVTFTDSEVYTLLSTSWPGGVAVLDKVEFDAAGRKLTAFRVPEAA